MQTQYRNNIRQYDMGNTERIYKPIIYRKENINFNHNQKHKDQHQE